MKSSLTSNGCGRDAATPWLDHKSRSFSPDHARFVRTAGLATALTALVILGWGASGAAAASCPNAAFRVGPSAGLPDCRAYEQVTPADKAGSQDIFTFGPGLPTGALAGDDGNTAYVTSGTSFDDAPNGMPFGYVFSRDASGWKMTGVTPGGGYLSQHGTPIFTPNMSSFASGYSSGTQYGPVSLLVGPPDGPYTTIGQTAASDEIEGYTQATSAFMGISSDGSHVVFQSLDHSLAPGANQQVDESQAVYEWSDGTTKLVNVTTGGQLTSPCGAMVGNGPLQGLSHNAVSSDGSRVFFVSPDPDAARLDGATDPSCSQPQHLYMRLSGTSTVDVSAPQPGVNDPNGYQPVSFAGASADGSRVFFVTKTELTRDDTTHDPELYEYDTSSGTLTRVSRGTSGSADGNVKWVLVSNDGSTVYFTATGQLAPGAHDVSGTTEYSNLYRYDTSTQTTKYIATINQGDYVPTDTYGGSQFGPDSSNNWYTTPDGRFLVFWSSEDLTGYNPGNPAYREVYRYDSADGSLTCVSCSPSGAPATGSASFAQDVSTGAGLSPETADQRSPRPISDSGNQVFFSSPDQLLPQDQNNNVDVYEWETPGSGSCETATADGGCLYLISSGQDSLDSYFIDSSSDGQNVFFATHAQLAPTDTDSEGDLYDARVDGGFAAPASPPPCSGDGCQGPLAPSPTVPTAATVTFGGPGNASSSARVVVLTHGVRGSAFLLRVKVPERGRITITGGGIRTVRMSVSRSGVYRHRVTLTGKDRRMLGRRGKLRLRLRVLYQPQAARSHVARVSLTVRSR